ncbi:hypothetical protein QVD17_37524 [Tagetes erecta]|uniref:Uncharacterized protein n=1 Tax=Tagetes erecta TaxID=13708 RepID=A0AAD8JYF4_TARER|nr:hypothetical protein QVD17_37524 [Tagetes erecta]
MATTTATVDATTTTTTKTPISTLRRRNSIDTPSTLILHHPSSSSSSYNTTTSSLTTTTTTSSSASSSADYELVSLKPPSYTSLRDILPSTTTTFINSPKPPSFTSNSTYEISIRNRLVKQAAWAYLQPMSTSPGSPGSTVFHRLWNRLSVAVLQLITHICSCFVSYKVLGAHLSSLCSNPKKVRFEARSGAGVSPSPDL